MQTMHTPLIIMLSCMTAHIPSTAPCQISRKLLVAAYYLVDPGRSTDTFQRSFVPSTVCLYNKSVIFRV